MVPGQVLTGTLSITGVRKRVILYLLSFSGWQNVSRNLKTVGRTLAAKVSLKIVQVSSDKRKLFLEP